MVLLANTILEKISDKAVWVDEFFHGYNIDLIEDKIALHLYHYYNSTIIHGFSHGINLEDLSKNFGMVEKNSITLLDVKNSIDLLIKKRRMISLSSLYLEIDGYCILSNKKIVNAEIDSNDQSISKLVQEIKTMKNKLSENDSKISELESNLSISEAKLRDKEAILIGRANLSWS